MKPDALLLLTVLFMTGYGHSQVSPRVTPLGTQRPKPDPANRPDKKSEPTNKEKPAETLERAVNAHGGRQALTSVRDSVSEGRLTFFSGRGAKNTIDVTVIRKGDSRVQRILKEGEGELHQGSDGTSTWESFNGMTALAPAGLAGNYIESETIRAVGNLFNSQGRGFQIRDAGAKNNARVLELEVPAGGKPATKTHFFVDEATSRVTRIEFATGEGKDLLGKKVPTTESYVFSDFRVVQGVSTAFRIERYVNGLKIEETQFTSVRYNTSVKDEVFKP
jgi:hypothetical protein